MTWENIAGQSAAAAWRWHLLHVPEFSASSRDLDMGSHTWQVTCIGWSGVDAPWILRVTNERRAQTVTCRSSLCAPIATRDLGEERTPTWRFVMLRTAASKKRGNL